MQSTVSVLIAGLLAANIALAEQPGESGSGRLLLASAAPTLRLAAAAQSQYWDHKDWRAMADSNMRGEFECRAWTGGDGNDSFVLVATRSGEVTVYFDEATARGYPTNLQEADTVQFVVTTPRPMLFDDVSVLVDIDEEGIPLAHAGTPDGYTPELVRALRAGHTVRLERENPSTGVYEVVSEFSLSGFTANYLKVSEWCGFDPDIRNLS